MRDNKPADYWIQALNLQKHPEGGYYCRTYCSDIKANTLEQKKAARPVASAIYYLLTSEDFSALHRLSSDEIWHFYWGSPITVYQINLDGTLTETTLGDPDHPKFQMVVPAHRWFASKTQLPNSYALVGCVVSPGFDFNDFELARREQLVNAYPQHQAFIKRFTRECV